MGSLFFSLPSIALANGDPCTDPNSAKLCNPVKYGNLPDFFLAIINTVVRYGLLLIVFFLVFAGFQFVTAQGNSEKLQKAKQNLLWIVIGAFVLLGVYVIRAAVCGTIGQLGIDVDCSI